MANLKILSDVRFRLLIFLISAISLYSFYVAWKQPTVPDDISFIAAKMIILAQKTKDKERQVQLYDSLKNLLDSSLSKRPNDVKLNYYMASYCILQKDYQKAISINVENLSKIDSVEYEALYFDTKLQTAMSYYYVGLNMLENKDTIGAINTMQKSFDYVLYYPSAVMKLSLINIENNKTDLARKMLVEGIKRNPGNTGLINMMGYAYYRENNFREAENYFLQTYKIEPKNIDANKFLTLIKEQSAK